MRTPNTSELIRSALSTGVFIQDSHPDLAPEGASYYYGEDTDEWQESKDASETSKGIDSSDWLLNGDDLYEPSCEDRIHADAWALASSPREAVCN